MDLFRRPWLLLLLPAFWAAAGALRYWAALRRERALAALGRPETLRRLYPAEAASRRGVRFWLEAAGLSLALFALAGPQWGVELVASSAQGLNVVVAIDTSLSMLTEDIAPSRMEKAKSELAQILDGLKGERVGVIAFAGAAHIQCPLTSDLDAAKSFLETVQVGLVPQPGTALAPALALGTRMLSKYAGHKAMVLLTDGEDNKGKSAGAAAEASQAGVQVFIVGVGTTEGGPIPLKDPQGKVAAFKKDKNGATVVSRLGEDGLIAIAKASSGAYFRATPDESEAASILRQISRIETSKIQGGSRPRYKDRYRLPLALAMLLLLAEMLVPETGPLALPAAAVLALVFSGCSGEKSAVDLWRGNREYSAGRYEKALDRYSSALARSPKDPRGHFNAGDAQYRMKNLDDAAEKFATLADPKRSPRDLLAPANYNLGDALFQKGDCANAAAAFKNCLLLDPKDEDCRFNLVKALDCMKSPPKKQPEQKPQDKPEDKKPDKKPEPPPPSDRSRPRPDMTQEDAERILQAIREREKNAKARQEQSNRPKSAENERPEVDW